MTDGGVPSTSESDVPPTRIRREPGTGSIYQQKGRTGYTVALKIPDPLRPGMTRTRSTTVATPEEGDAILADWLNMTPEAHATETGAVTVAAAAMRWLEEKDPSLDRSNHDFLLDPTLPRTWRGYESEVATHIVPNLGATPIADLDAVAVRKFLAKLQKTPSGRVPAGASVAPPVSHSTVLKVYRRLHAILTYAVLRKWITAHPMVGMKPPKPVRRSELHAVEADPAERALEWDEVTDLLDALDLLYPHHPDYRILKRLMAETGLRQAEACGLTVQRVNLRRGTIRVAQQLVPVDHEHGCEGEWGGRGVSPCTLAAIAAGRDPDRRPLTAYQCPDRVAGGWFIDQDTKSHQRRTVPITRGLAEDLARLIAARPERSPAEERARERARRASRYPVAFADLLFVAERGGGHISKSLSNELLHRAADRAGVDLAGRTDHAFRHTAATTMIRSGLDLGRVQYLLGHSSLAVLQRYYKGDHGDHRRVASEIERQIQLELSRAFDNAATWLLAESETNT